MRNESVIAITRNTVSGPSLERLQSVATTRIWPQPEPPPEPELIEHISGCAAVLSPAGKFTRRVFENAPDLEIIALTSAGYDSVDIQAASDNEVVVTNVRGVLGETVADLTFSLLLMARRRICETRDIWKAKGWQAARTGKSMGLDVWGARLGLIGYGEIAQAVARRAHGFGMTVSHTFSRHGSDAISTSLPFQTVLEQSDVISLHIPLTSETEGLIGPNELRRMGPQTTLLNTARGGLIDEEALLDALTKGVIHSVGLDTYSAEPHNAHSELVTHERVVAVPHIGSATQATRSAMERCAVDNILKYFQTGAALTPVN